MILKFPQQRWKKKRKRESERDSPCWWWQPLHKPGRTPQRSCLSLSGSPLPSRHPSLWCPWPRTCKDRMVKGWALAQKKSGWKMGMEKSWYRRNGQR
jgi:hypothetical protein